MSVPTVYHESKGISVLEAMANGVPVVLPRHGAFPELIETTGAGLLCEPMNPVALADALAELIRDPTRAADCGRRGYEAIRKYHTADHMAQEHVASLSANVRRKIADAGRANGPRHTSLRHHPRTRCAPKIEGANGPIHIGVIHGGRAAINRAFNPLSFCRPKSWALPRLISSGPLALSIVQLFPDRAGCHGRTRNRAHDAELARRRRRVCPSTLILHPAIRPALRSTPT